MRFLKIAVLVFGLGLLGGWATTQTSAQGQWTLVGWNDLGMHCMDASYDVFSILPPYNNVHAQLMNARGDLVTDAAGLHVTYEAVADAGGSTNSTSVGKTDFWGRARQLFGVDLAPDVGLAGQAMPGAANVPQPMPFDEGLSSFVAVGVPMTPYDDAGRYNAYPMMRLVARDGSGAVLASTNVVLPVSDEMDCRACHGSGGSPAARPEAGWVADPDPNRDYRLNILRLHDRHVGEPAYDNALAATGLNADGLHATVVVSDTAVLCAGCHASNALGTSGVAGAPTLTEGVHGLHAGVTDPVAGGTLEDASNRDACYRCHPGSSTRCLRGAMGSAVAADGSYAIQCQDCHGTMSAVGAPGRAGWLDEPTCQSCHTGTAVSNAGALRYTTVFDGTGNVRQAADPRFATNAGVPAAGLSLYRFSVGHGDLQCEACHGSTHAESPSALASDNAQALAIQGHVGMLAECDACHAQTPRTTTGGPHGLHPIGQAWIEGHKDPAESRPEACRDCHGVDDRGTVLSRALGDRTLSAFGTKELWQGFQIGCYTCHNGPRDEERNPNRPPVVQDASATTTTDQSVAIDLVASDPDGDALTLRIVSQPASGRVGLAGRTATYFPDQGVPGVFRFTFAAWDGSTNSNLGTVTITVGTAPGASATPSPTTARTATATSTVSPSVTSTAGTPAATVTASATAGTPAATVTASATASASATGGTASETATSTVTRTPEAPRTATSTPPNGDWWIYLPYVQSDVD